MSQSLLVKDVLSTLHVTRDAVSSATCCFSELQHLASDLIILQDAYKLWEDNLHQSGATTLSANSVQGALSGTNISSAMNDSVSTMG